MPHIRFFCSSAFQALSEANLGDVNFPDKNMPQWLSLNVKSPNILTRTFHHDRDDRAGYWFVADFFEEAL